MLTEMIGSCIRFLSGTENPAQWLIDLVHGGEKTSSGENITEENALTCPPVKAAVCVLAETIAMLPIWVYRREKSGKEVLAPDHPAQELLERASNPDTSAPILKHTLQLDLGTYGNAYAFIEKTVRGKPIALWNYSPKPERTEPVRNKKDGKIYYRSRDDKGRELEMIPASEMLHIPYLSPDGIIGRSPIRLLRESIGGDRAAQRLGNEFFKNGGVAEGNFTTPDKLGEQAYRRLKADIELEAEHGERHKRRILEQGMKYEPSQSDPQKLQMLDSRRFTVQEVGCFYRISPHLLQDLTHGTFSNITELGRQFIMFTMRPWFTFWEGELNRKLVLPPYFCRFDFMEFMRGDNQAMAAFFRTMFGVGAFSVNQILTELGYNEIDAPNADEHFIPLNMVPLSKATDPEWNKKSQPSEKKPGAPPVGDGETPGTPGPVSEPAEESPLTVGAEVLAASEAVLADVLTRMARIEAKAAIRAAKNHGTFVATVDAFFCAHVETLRDAVELPAAAVKAAGGLQNRGLTWRQTLDSIVAEHLYGKREALLTAAECKPVELSDRVTACVELWTKTGTNPNLGV